MYAYYVVIYTKLKQLQLQSVDTSFDNAFRFFISGTS